MKTTQPFPLAIPALTVITAQAGIQQLKNAFGLSPLDSRLRGNDAAMGAQ